jgi:hypothetical protein
MEGNRVNKTISKRPSGVFYIDGNKAFYFEQSLPAPISLEIPADTLSNFELINKKKLVTIIQTFVRNYKLAPKNIVILLSVYSTFDREFPHGSIELQKHIQEFLELVPFEELLQKKIVTSGKTRVIATNKEVCEAVKSSFTSSGFLVSGIYPLSISMELIPELKTNLDLSLFVNKLTDLKNINLAPVIEASYASTFGTPIVKNVVTEEKEEKPDRKRLYALSGVFGVLILILGIVFYTSIIAPGKDTPKTLPLPTLAPLPPATVNQTVPGENPPVSTQSSQNVSSPSSTTGLP